MRRLALLALLCATALGARPAGAQPVRDCPQAQVPLSSGSPLTDVLLHPAGRQALDAVAPGLVEQFTSNFGGGDLPPGFAAILTPELLLETSGTDPEAAARLDDRLAELPIDDAFILARCARYDNERPELSPPDDRPSILVFEKITGFRDAPSVAAAREALRSIAEERGWQMIFTDRGGVMNAADLARFDAVVWNNVSGDALTLPQRAAFRDYVEQGGGFVGIHGSGGDPRYFWDWYADTLIGARFIGHTGSPQFQETTVSLVDGRSDIADGVAPTFELVEEWYSFDRNPTDGGAVVVATIDESQYDTTGYAGQSIAMGEHPIAWRKYVGDGRAFYTAIGHRPEAYRHQDAAQLLANGIAWVLQGRSSEAETESALLPCTRLPAPTAR